MNTRTSKRPKSGLPKRSITGMGMVASMVTRGPGPDVCKADFLIRLQNVPPVLRDRPGRSTGDSAPSVPQFVEG